MNKGKTSRKVLSAIVTTLAAFGAWAETQFTYTVTNGEATITEATDIGESLDIPGIIDGYPVVAIGNSAFNFNLDLERLTIPEGIKNIGEHAFSLCHGLKEVIIPDSVTNIGHYAFYKCYDVERIEIGSGVKTIGHWAFAECYALSELHIAHGVETIEEYAFGLCYCLESVTLPSSVKKLKWGAFANIDALQTAYIHAATEKSGGVFENSPNVDVRYYNCQTPAAPQPAWSVEATDDLNGRIRVSWEMDTESEVSGYQIYRAMRPHLKKATLVAEVPAGGELVYEDTDVSSDYTYCYWVRPVNDIFSGAVSEVATGYCEEPREELTFYVDAANGDDGNTGLTRGSAFKTLQKAIDLAGNWDKIIVADGVYASIATHNRRVVIESENGYKNAIIDGGGESVCAWLGGADVETDPDEPLPYTLDNWAGNKTILRGFTLRNGSGRCGAGAIGGTLENCLIVSNVVEATTSYSASPDGFGGGAYNSILRNCTITDNSSLPLFSDDDTKWGGLGGGCWNCKLYGCIEWGNTEDPENSESAMWWGGSSNEYDEFCYLDDPIFADAANGDYRLTRNSPAVVEGVVTAGCDTEVVEPKTLYVDAANGNDTADGLSKANAVKTLQTAVDRAVDGDRILVADGTYAPIHVGDKRITIESENGYKTTIIDGGGTNGCILAEYNVIGFSFPSTNMVLRGFTLTNGYEYHGAGTYGGTLERCLIVNNTACTDGPTHGEDQGRSDGKGGGAYGALMCYCTIVGNSAEFWYGDDGEGELYALGGEGGGVYGCTLENCIVYGNEGEITSDASSSEYSNDSLVGVDPLFANAANGDYRLMSSSPCVVNGVATAGCEAEVVEPKTLYVDAANGNDTADGLSKAKAVKTLQMAIDRAVNGDTILVADGVYAPIETHAKRILIESENGYKTTIIDGERMSSCVFGGFNSRFYELATPSTNTVIRGFSLINGRDWIGGGVFGCVVEKCLIRNCIAYNEEPGFGASYCYGQGGGAIHSVLRDCTVVGNTAEALQDDYDSYVLGGEGGGVYGCVLERCIVYGNYGATEPDAFDSKYLSDSVVGVDPLFVSAANGDYRLMSSSPCVVNGVATAGCETEVMSGTVPELTPAQAAVWVSNDLAARYAKSGESAADYQNRFEAKFGADSVAAMAMPTDKKDVQGNDMYVWQDYVAGTDPTDTNSVFTATITMVDGAPVVEWSPKLSAAEEARRRYTIYGKAGLESGEEWHSPTNAHDRFFRVGVEMR